MSDLKLGSETPFSFKSLTRFSLRYTYLHQFQEHIAYLQRNLTAESGWLNSLSILTFGFRHCLTGRISERDSQKQCPSYDESNYEVISENYTTGFRKKIRNVSNCKKMIETKYETVFYNSGFPQHISPDYSVLRSAEEQQCTNRTPQRYSDSIYPS